MLLLLLLLLFLLTQPEHPAQRDDDPRDEREQHGVGRPEPPERGAHHGHQRHGAHSHLGARAQQEVHQAGDERRVKAVLKKINLHYFPNPNLYFS